MCTAVVGSTEPRQHNIQICRYAHAYIIDEVSKDELPAHQKELTRYALSHPIRLAVGSGAAGAGWAAAVVGDWRAIMTTGIGTALIAGYLWSPRGPARRRERRLYDDNGNRRPDA